MYDFETVRPYLRWVEGQLEARLGDFDQAIKRLDRVRKVLVRHGPLRLAVAVTLDMAAIYCRHEYGANVYPEDISRLRWFVDKFAESQEDNSSCL